MPPKRLLIISLRRLGDVLLATPLAVSLRAAWPEVEIDWLVYSDCIGPLTDNPAADSVIAIDPSVWSRSSLVLALKNFQRYDLAISTQSGDRPSYLARAIGRRAITFRSSAQGSRIRDLFFSDIVDSPSGHKVEQVLSLLVPLGVKKIRRVSAPRTDFSAVKNFTTDPYVVFHPGAAFSYKRWTAAGWRSLFERFTERSFRVIITGGSHPSEKHYLDSIFCGLNVLRADGMLSWTQLTGILTRATCYVGVDTSVTHLAAACNVPGVAIYGPTDPLLWGPYSFSASSTIEVVRRVLSCSPCQQEGCDQHSTSRSFCLDTLDVENVWKNIVSRNLIA